MAAIFFADFFIDIASINHPIWSDSKQIQFSSINLFVSMNDFLCEYKISILLFQKKNQLKIQLIKIINV